MKRSLFAATCLALTTPAFATPSEEAMLKGHVAFLASDAMRGREAGSPEYDIAAEYVASQYMALGLTPAGDNGKYLQAVPLVSTKLTDKGMITLRGRPAISISARIMCSVAVKSHESPGVVW